MQQPQQDSTSPDASISRRTLLKGSAAGLLAIGTATRIPAQQGKSSPNSPRPWLKVRGVYGGFPRELLQRGEQPADYGINAIWVGSGALDAAEIDRYHRQGLKVFAEFNSMHSAGYLKDHPDAAPVGPDGKPSPPPHGWQGVSPFHAGYRQERMQEFRRVLATFEIDGIWLDYHHAHASWERDEPSLPDTDFSPPALRLFTEQTGIKLPIDAPAAAAAMLLGEHQEAWTKFRCDVFTDWVREYRAVLNAVRPRALLGTFHCPWSPDEYDGAIRRKLAIDLTSQAAYLDVFSIMPYHARFGHVDDPAWIARQVRRLGELLGIHGTDDEAKRIWPIVQLSDWGERVPVEQVEAVLDYGSRQPATGIMAFHWNGMSKEWSKMEALKRAYTAFRPATDPLPAAGLRIADRFVRENKHERNYRFDLALGALLELSEVSGDPKYRDHVSAIVARRGWTPATEVSYREQSFTCLTYGLFQATGDRNWLSVFLDESRKFRDGISRSPEGAVLHARGRERGGGEAMLLDSMQEYVARMARAGALSGDKTYFVEAAKQIRLYRSIVRNPQTELWHQGRGWLKDQPEQISPGAWSRGHGWLLRGLTAALAEMPRESAEYREMQGTLVELADALLTRQQPSGMWHCLLDRPPAASPPESSGTAMIAAALARAWREGTLLGDQYRDAALRAFGALPGYVDAEGVVLSVSPGPGPLESEEPWLVNAFPPGNDHGTFALMYAAAESVRLNRHMNRH